jgi:arginase family enzyme
MSFQVCQLTSHLTSEANGSSGGQARSGVDLGPNRLIKAGIIPQISNLGWEVHYDSSLTFLDIPYNPLPINSPEATEFAGDKPVKSKKGFVQRTEDPDIGRMKKPRLVSAVCERVGDKVGDIAKKGWLPLTLGGDHSLVSQPGLFLQDSEELMIGNGYCCWHQVEIPRRLCHLGE